MELVLEIFARNI